MICEYCGAKQETEKKFIQGKDVRLYLIWSIILLFIGIFLLLLTFFFGPEPGVRGIYFYEMLFLSIMMITLQSISIIAYFSCPEITYGMTRILRKTKNEENKLIRLGRNIQIYWFVVVIILMVIFVITTIIVNL
ncbi:hypothetical protein ES703_102046 [subsurface metagenome]